VKVLLIFIGLDDTDMKEKDMRELEWEQEE